MKFIRSLLLAVVLPAVIFISIGCNPAPIAGDYGGAYTRCENAIAATKQNCMLALQDWAINCTYNPITHQCVCIGLLYATCLDVQDVQANCGDCPEQAYRNAVFGLRARERDTIDNLTAKFAGETLL